MSGLAEVLDTHGREGARGYLRQRPEILTVCFGFPLMYTLGGPDGAGYTSICVPNFRFGSRVAKPAPAQQPATPGQDVPDIAFDNQAVMDFVVPTCRSLDLIVALVKLEEPTEKPFTESGMYTQTLSDAISHMSNWMARICERPLPFTSALSDAVNQMYGFVPRQGTQGLRLWAFMDIFGKILISRRALLSERDNKLRAVINKQTRVEIVPYDRLVEAEDALDKKGLRVVVEEIALRSGQEMAEDREDMDERETAEPTSILFLAADPTDSSRLRLGEELREIQEKLQLAKLRERFRLDQRMSVRPVDISQALLDVQPQIVHFSGHGMSTGELCFENELGLVQTVDPGALSALFEQFSACVNCVVLNSCFSEPQAKAIAEHIDYVIGMSGAIGDKAAIAFAVGFYQALGGGRSIAESYMLGCIQMRLRGIPEHLTPVLVRKGGAHEKRTL